MEFSKLKSKFAIIFKFLTCTAVVFVVSLIVHSVTHNIQSKQPVINIRDPTFYNSGRFSVRLKSPVYLYDGTLATTEAFVDTQEKADALSNLVCAENNSPTDTTVWCRYGTCAFVISKTMEQIVDKARNQPKWTREDYEKTSTFLMANFQQSWFAGVTHEDQSDLTIWYRIPSELEDYMAQHMLTMQKAVCNTFLEKVMIWEVVPSIPRPVVEYTYIRDVIPQCGTDTFKNFSFRRGDYVTKYDGLKANWSPVCRWRANDKAQWRIFSTLNTTNILHVVTDEVKSQKYIKTYQENRTLTTLLPEDNLNFMKAVPTVY